jgi:16S rRNA (cytosine1407-C5)-methyltransferase
MLVYNIDRMNLMNAGVIHYKGEWLSKIYSEHFDKILVDAPCSGLGIVQKKGEVNNWWSLERAERLGDLQLRLLIAAIKMTKEGGEIVYSTCTLTPEENEFIIDKVLQKYPVEIEEINLPVPSREGFTLYNGKSLSSSISKAKRILPWEIDSDGFFIVKLKKVGKTVSPEMAPPKSANIRMLDYEKGTIKKLLGNIENEFEITGDALKKYKYLIKRNDIYFIDRNWEENNLDIFDRIGTRFGTIDKNGKTILHTQASQVLHEAIKRRIFEIDNLEDLKTYLDGGTMKNKIFENGQCVVKYKNSVLGTAIVTSQGIKSRFPRSKRTQEILIQ